MKLHFEVSGSGPLAIVFTHGLAASGDAWRAQVEAFSPRFRVLTWDLRGHGRSSGPAVPCRLGDLAADLRQVLDRAGIESAAIVGHSAGGAIALQFALDYPGRTAGLVLVGTSSECNSRARQFYEDVAAIAEQQGMKPVLKRLGLTEETNHTAPVDPAGFAHVARAMGNMYEHPLTSRLPEVRCPTLIIVGENDILGAGGSVIMSRGIAGSRLDIVPERGHGLFLEDPAGFNRLVGEFLAALPEST